MHDIQVTPQEVKARLDRGERLLLVDCREPNEHALCRIEGARLVPMGDVPAHLALFDESADVVVYCHHGQRSLNVAAWLRQQGVAGARSMAGGIERWSLEIDPTVPRY